MAREKPNIQSFSFYLASIVVFAIISFLIPSNSIVNFWARDLPPLTGELKFIYNALIFLLCVHAYWERKPAGDSPLQAPFMYKHSNPLAFSPQGIMKYLGMHKWANYQTLTVLRTMMVVSWFFSSIGFGGRVSTFINGITWLLLHSYCVGMKGVNHRWYVAMYAMLILTISNTCKLSLDNFIHENVANWWPFYYDPSQDLWGSLTRKFVAFGAMMTLQGGAFAKLRNTGFSWGNGITLQYYCQREEGVWNSLRLFTLNSRLFAFLLATGSLVLEGVAFLVLFDDNVRTVLFVMFLGMHVGIYFVMYPSYGPQSVTYMLCISWGASNKALQTLPASDELVLACRLVMIACLFLVFLSWFLLEWYPFTGVPMYSFNREGYQMSHLRDLNQAAEVSKEYVNSCYPWPIAWSMYWVELRIVSGDKVLKTNESVNVLPVERRFLPKHLRRILHKVAGVHLYNKNFIKDNSNIAKDFLQIMASYYQSFAQEWLTNQKSTPRLELVLILKGGPHVLESVEIPKSGYTGQLKHLGLWLNGLEKELIKKIQK